MDHAVWVPAQGRDDEKGRSVLDIPQQPTIGPASGEPFPRSVSLYSLLSRPRRSNARRKTWGERHAALAERRDAAGLQLPTLQKQQFKTQQRKGEHRC
jgi:hypothetical protein